MLWNKVLPRRWIQNKISSSSSNHKRRIWICTCLQSKKSHYQTLGITSNASQADIKKAYYDLSMKFHPDKSKGSEDKFKVITTAYEVLGNPRLRRLYDRGVMSHDEDVTTSHHSSHSDTDVSEASQEQSEAAKASVRTFDSWAKTHYSETFNRSQEEKYHKNAKKRLKTEKSESGEGLLWIFGLLFLLGTFIKISLPREEAVKKKP